MGKVTKLDWTRDGSILTIATSNGYFCGFLTVIPSLISAHDTYAALLSSLTEVSVIDCHKGNICLAKTALEIEPSFLKLGPLHFAVGVNSTISYYRWRQSEVFTNKKSRATEVMQRDYFGTIK